MNFTEEELEKQDSEILFNLRLVFIPIAIMLFAVFYYQSNSVDYTLEKYKNSKAVELNGIIIKKKQDGDYSRSPKYVFFENYHKELVTNETYYKVNIGDKVIKRNGEDSIYFYLKNGEIIVEDYNKFEREQYQSAIEDK
jgi:hypothetical protein